MSKLFCIISGTKTASDDRASFRDAASQSAINRVVFVLGGERGGMRRRSAGVVAPLHTGSGAVEGSIRRALPAPLALAGRED